MTKDEMASLAETLIVAGQIGEFLDVLYAKTHRAFMDPILLAAQCRHPDPTPQPREGNFLYY